MNMIFLVHGETSVASAKSQVMMTLKPVGVIFLAGGGRAER